MRVSVHRLVALSLVTLLVAACGSAAGSPSPVPAPSGSSAPPPSTPPATAEPSPTPDETVAARARLRVTTVQALPPDTTFAVIPQIVISNDGRVLMGGPIPLIFPGPLVTPVVERQIGPAGWSRLVAAARAAGLLGLNRDFTGGQMPPGSAATRLEIVADGLAYDLLGDANRVMVCVQEPCAPPPGTPEAFAGFVNGLWDITTMAGAENLGPERVHAPAAYGVLVGAVPDDGGLAQQAIDWPLDGGFAWDPLESTCRHASLSIL